jgi:hypothetical protein
MSEIKIKDGEGNARLAGVTSTKRLKVDAVQRAEADNANIEGKAFNINTMGITLSDAADTAILYLENNGTETLVIESIAVGVGPSTGGSGEIPEITVVRNPTSASFSTAVSINSNRNYGSENTLTGGVDHLYFFQKEEGRLFANIKEILPKGTSMGVKFKPETGNTSQKIYAALIAYLI